MKLLLNSQYGPVAMLQSSRLYANPHGNVDAAAHGLSAPQVNDDLRLVKGSRLYKEFASERDEILRHKWIESEKVGRDIGFEKALLDWVIKHRSAWRAHRQPASC